MSSKKKPQKSNPQGKPPGQFDQFNPLDYSDFTPMAELLNEAPQTSSPNTRKKTKCFTSHKPTQLPLDLDNLPSMDEMLNPHQTEAQALDYKTDLKIPKCLSTRAKGPKVPSQLVTFDRLGNREQFMDPSEGIPSKKEMIEGTVIHKREEGILVDIGYGSQGLIARHHNEIWNSVETGDRILVSFNSAKSERNFPKLTPHKILRRSKKSSAKPKLKVDTKSLAGNCFVIDGSNINRSYLNLQGSSSLTPLLTLATLLLSYKARFYCIFDANERFVLEENKFEPQGPDIYDHLIREQKTVFFQVPGGSDADDYILETAHHYKLPIISNDRFNKIEDFHNESYPWLNTNPSRVIKGKVENGILMVENLGINNPLGSNLSILYIQLKNHLDKK